MLLLVLDTETTGLLNTIPPPDIIEIAAALYCTETRTTIASVQFLFPCENNPAEHINGISSECLLRMLEADTFVGVDYLITLWKRCDYVVAHNASFDKHFVDEIEAFREFPKEWICTYKDITFPKTRRSKVLSHIAVDHGIIPTDAHRAMGDVMTLVRLLDLVDDLDEQIKRTMDLKLYGKRYIIDEYIKDTAECTKLGFTYDRNLRKYNKLMLESEVEGMPFAVSQVPI